MNKIIRLTTVMIIAMIFARAPYALGDNDSGDSPELPTPKQAGAPSAGRSILRGPDSVDNQLQDDTQQKPSILDLEIIDPWEAFKNNLHEDTGIRIGGDYTAVYQHATDSPGEDDAVGGIIRLYGSWDIVGRGTTDAGGLIFKVEHRHRSTDLPPSGLGSEIGYVGLFEAPFSKEGSRLTNLYWRQRFSDGRFVTYLGFLDVTDYVDVFALASPWTGFTNFAFSTGSATIGLPNDAALGVMAGYWITESVYTIGSITDANADPTDPFEGFDTFFDEFETFQSLEFGWTPTKDDYFLTNVHVTLWHVDARQSAGTPEGWGGNLSATTWIDERWLLFLRGGLAEDGGSLLESSVSTGFGYQAVRGGDVLGVGFNWGEPNTTTFGPGLDDQFTTEVFYRLQVTPNFAITPSIQLLIDPALNQEDDTIGIFGVRARAQF
jgi:porin